jgi:hypothetical protein
VANIKRLEQLTGWIEYPLITALLDPPILKLRLRPMDSFDMLTSTVPGDPSFRFGQFAADNAVAAVAEWDLTENGVAIPVTPENKVLYLRPILAEMVDGRGLLGLAILEDSQNRTLFLKN